MPVSFKYSFWLFLWLFLLSYTCQHLSRTPIKADSPFITFLEKTIKLKKVDCRKVKGACFISRQDEFSSLSFVVSDFKIKNFGENESIEISLHESNSNGGYPRYLGSFELYIDINFSKNILNKKDWETNQKYLNLAQEVLNNWKLLMINQIRICLLRLSNYPYF